MRRNAPFALLSALTLGLVVALAWRDRALPAGDLLLFASAGRTLLSGSWVHTYHAAGIQAGPFELGFVGGITRVFGRTSTALALAADLTGAVALLAVARAYLGRRIAMIALVVAAALVFGITGDPFLDGHPAELAIAFSWLFAARDARNGRVGRAALLVGLSCGWELWGLLGVAVLALAPRPRSVVTGGVLAGVVCAALLAPFVAAGDFHMFAFRWTIAGDSVPGVLFGAGEPFAWPLRAAQGAIAIVAGVAAARLLRRRPESVWIVPALVALAKIALDPVRYPYYWDTPLVLLLLGVAGLAVTLREDAQARGEGGSLLHRRIAGGRPEMDQRDDALVSG